MDAAAALRLPAERSGSGPADSGYLMINDQGKVDAFGDVAHWGDAWGDLGEARATHLEPLASGAGYWILDEAGHVSSFGAARHSADIAASRRAPGEKAVTQSALPGGDGYWIFTDAGRVFPFGWAQACGDLSGVRLARPIVAAVGTPTGRGYMMVSDDGGVFANQAPYRGSLGSTRLNAPTTGMAACGDGCFLVSSDGGVFDFSSCPFVGSLGTARPPTPSSG